MADKLALRVRQVGPWPMNSYALICPSTGESVLFDPGADPDALEAMLAGSKPTAILITHTHFDHVNALGEMRQRLDVPVMAHPGPHDTQLIPDADHALTDGQKIPVGEHALRAVFAPGHIADQVCFVLEDDHRVIVGDTIFEGGPGKTWSPEAFKQTLETMRSVVLPWPDDTVCYPGHGSHFRLGDRRAAIEAFLVKDHGAFFGDATWDM